MSNTVDWRAKPRTSKPSSRQKRNGLLLDARPTCERCHTRKSREAHHDLPPGHPERNDPANMRALCIPCHVAVHAPEPRFMIKARDRAPYGSNGGSLQLG